MRKGWDRNTGFWNTSYLLVVIYGCGRWTIKKAENQRTDTFELWCCRRLESPLEYKEIKPVNPIGNQLWIFIGRTDAEAEAPIPWPTEGNSQLFGRVWWWERLKAGGEVGDRVIGWHHQLNGHEFKQTQGDSKGQGSLVCCSSWGYKQSDMTEWLN